MFLMLLTAWSMLQDLLSKSRTKVFLSQVQSKLLIRFVSSNIHMDFFLHMYISGSTPSSSRKNPIGVFFFSPKVSATLVTWKFSCPNLLEKQCGCQKLFCDQASSQKWGGESPLEIEIYLALSVSTAQRCVHEHK